MVSACAVVYMLSGFPQKGKGRSEERCLLVQMKEKVGGEGAATHLIGILACSALYPLHNRQDEGAGPGTPLAGLCAFRDTVKGISCISCRWETFLAFS